MKTTTYSWVEELYMRGDGLFNNGEYIEGKAVFEEILEIEPDYGKAHNALGWLYFYHLDEYTRSENHFNYAIRFSPEYPASYLNYTYLLAYLRRYDTMREVISKGLEVEGANRSALYTELAKAEELSGNYGVAVKVLKEAIRFSVNDHEIEVLNAAMERVKRKRTLFAAKFFSLY